MSVERSTLCNIIVRLRAVEDPRQVARTLKSVDHALAVMEFLAGVTDPQTLTAVSQRFDMPKASMHRLLATLRFHGYVAKDPITARYSFGMTTMRLAQRADAAASRAQDRRRAIWWRWQRTDKTVLLVRDGGAVATTENLDSCRPLLATYSPGRPAPLYDVSLGMALLASSPDAEIRDVIISTHAAVYTQQSNPMVDAVGHDVRSTCTNGEAINYEYYRDGVCGVAASVNGLDPRGAVVAIAACVPGIRFESQLDSLRELIVVAAGTASSALTTDTVTTSNIVAD